MSKFTYIIFMFTTLTLMLVITSCDRKISTWSEMTKAESLINTYPDSSYNVLSQIDKNKLTGDTEKARYALLMSMALDKNMVDTTSFEILQPAIDYYKTNGTTDEKLRTLYYQGRIYQNRSDLDNAMRCFLNAREYDGHYSDTLTYANLLVAQGSLYYSSYQINEYISNNLIASRLYDDIKNDDHRQFSLLRALNGTIIVGDKERADSIITVTDMLSAKVSHSQDMLSILKFLYDVNYNTEISDFNNIEENNAVLSSLSDSYKMDIASGYLRQNLPLKAKSIFNTIDTCGEPANSLKYNLLKAEIYSANNDYKSAYSALKKYIDDEDDEITRIYLQKTSVAQERHATEMANMQTMHRKDNQLWFCLTIILALMLVCLVVYYLHYKGKTSRKIAEEEKLRLGIENDILNLQINQLEEERDKLKVIAEESELSEEVKKVLRERLSMLNAMLAADISNKQSYSKPYDEWVAKISKEKEDFMKSNSVAFEISHPKFIQYLRENNLTNGEISYVCLFALGLKGKDAGNYIADTRHYHKSCAIRKKLGLGENDTNLDIFIRRMLKQF